MAHIGRPAGTGKLREKSEIIEAWKHVASLKRIPAKFQDAVAARLGVSERTLQRAIANFEIRGILRGIYDVRVEASVRNGHKPKTRKE